MKSLTINDVYISFDSIHLFLEIYEFVKYLCVMFFFSLGNIGKHMGHSKKNVFHILYLRFRFYGIIDKHNNITLRTLHTKIRI
jgi:hypothetical protein